MTLAWRKIDDYHIASVCGKYTVAFVKVLGPVHVIAWRKPYTELGSVVLPASASDVERSEAIRQMQAVCSENAGSHHEPSN